jgi:predicted transcriptional regulator
MDLDKLRALHSKGLSGTAIAEELGVTKGGVSKQLKKLNLAVVKNIVLESADKVVRKNLTAIEQLQKINTAANDILNTLLKLIKGDKAALKDLEKHPDFKLKDPRELALKACSEIRGQLGLQADLFDKMYNARYTAEFQDEVLTAIGEVEPNVRKRIIQRLKERGALRSTVSIP